MNKKQPPSVWESLVLMGQFGFVIAIPIALGSILGNYLDGVTHMKSLFLILGLLLGLAAGIFGAYRVLAPFLKKNLK